MIRIFLDSGAYSLYHRFLSHSDGKNYEYIETDAFWEYVDNYAAYVKKNISLIETYVNVDVIFNPKASWKLQKYLEKEHGLKPLPVFHFGEDIKWFKRYMDNYEYIGISGVGKETPRSAYINYADSVFNLVCSNKDRLPEWRIHGFAMTSPNFLFRYPWYSVDSTSWVQFSKFGAIIIPRTILKKIRYDSSPTVIFLSHKSPKKTQPDGYHYMQLGKVTKNEVLKYVNKLGFVLGESKMEKIDGKEKEIIVEKGLCNDYKYRDQFNLLYFLELEKNLPSWTRPFKKENVIFDTGIKNTKEYSYKYRGGKTKLFFAGNFPQLKEYKEEKKVANLVINRYNTYNRLITFFFKDDMQSVLDLRKEELNENNS